MRISRSDESRFAAWWFTVDHALLTVITALVAAGLVLSLAASPAVAIKKGLDTYHFVVRHFAFASAGVVVMLAVSLLSPTGVRRLALALLTFSVLGMIAVLIVGEDINGAQRWLTFAGFSIQPSEFAKPGAIVLFAWLLAEASKRDDVPALPLAFLLWAILAALLLAEPDVGQTLLISATAGTLYFVAGLSLMGVGILLAIGSAGLVAAYQVFPHVHTRVDRHFGSSVVIENSQVDRAIKSFTEGGFLGRGPGEGTIKTALPDAHTDFIFAVVGEEYGVLACLALLALFAFVVLRALSHARQEPDAAIRLATQGLAIMFGIQALINIGVNVGLLPAKGMTLPFISAGGSSLLAQSITAGMMLALTRRRADAGRLKKPGLVGTIDALSMRGQLDPK